VSRRTLILLTLLLSSCKQDVREVRLAGVDLSDLAGVQKLGRALDAAERTALVTYAMIHAPGAAGFCGQKLVDRRGKDPQTIGEAIKLTLAREAQIRDAQISSQAEMTPIELAAQEWDRIVDQRELIIHRRNVLTMEHGDAASRLPEWSELEVKMKGYDQRMEGLWAKLGK
jgi:hypothetical protein